MTYRTNQQAGRVGHDNMVFAKMAPASLAAYDRVSGGGVTDRRLFVLLLASLMHKADAEDWNFDEQLQASRELYSVEKET
ncbi:MAG: hypothetical protein KGL39_03180 [Patescibacteria group bacterium]|nr:hypothetical protein [Patescibacteria group bacterium]